MAEKDIITMRQEELKRLHIVKKVLGKELKQIEAAEKIGLSYRQIKRITKRVKEEGDKGVIHKSRGQPSKRRLSDKIKNKILALYRRRYRGFGPTFAIEKLFEIERIKISKETLRLWLIREGLWVRHRKVKKYRRWRERKQRFGEMVQLDGSHHDWFEGRGPRCVLMGYIDDATSTSYARFYPYEGTIPAFDSLKCYIKRYGIPNSIYLDKYSTYKSLKKPTIDDQLNNREFLSQFERAAKELGITIIHANSAPAKGRIERSFKTYQDRLVKEMRLKNISTIEEANRFLKEFLPKHNKRFGIKPVKEGNLHSPAPNSRDLDKILCIKTERVLRNDFTIAYKKKLYQILDKTAGKKLMVEERINETMHITHKGESLRYKQIIARPQEIKPEPKIRKINRPAQDHPWRNVRGGWLKPKKSRETMALINA